MPDQPAAVVSNGAWKRGLARAVRLASGESPVVRNGRFRFVGVAGRWVLADAQGLPLTPTAGVPLLSWASAYGGQQGQGDINVHGDNFQAVSGLPGNPTTYACWQVGGSLADGLGNYGNLQLQPSGSPTYDLIDGQSYLILDGTIYFRAPGGGSGYPHDYVVGTTGNLVRGASLVFVVPTMPTGSTKWWLWYTGDLNHGEGVYLRSDGALVWYQREGATVNETASPAGLVAADVPAAFYLFKGTTLANCRWWINGVDRGQPGARVTVLGDASLTQRTYIGRGPDINGGYPAPGWVASPIRARRWRLANLDERAQGDAWSSVQGAVKYQLTADAGAGAVLRPASFLVKVVNDEHLIIRIPESVSPGHYLFTIDNGNGTSNALPLSVWAKPTQTAAIVDDFSDPQRSQRLWMAGHKQWGGANGGIVAANVALQDGHCVIEAHGDLYAGPVTGVDKRGRPVVRTDRVGGGIVTRNYYGPGSYRVRARLPPQTGVAIAFWTFHYEEIYPNEPGWAAALAEGLVQQGSAENGFYIVRNHEIDIEIPTAVDGDPDQENASLLNARFNTWRGEVTEYADTFMPHGLDPRDGAVHEYRIDWHTTPGSERVEFYTDGVLRRTETAYIPDISGRFWIALWFPSAATKWAGATAPWSKQQLVVERFEFTPFAGEPFRSIGETYPLDVFREIDLDNRLP